MKKILLITLLLFTISVSAKENKLYFIEKDHQVCYESGTYDEKVFMRHTDMVPGSKYTDELTIENGTTKTYKLYFKVEPTKDNLNSDLLKHMTMKITIDGKEIYDGKVTGEGNINLANSVYLGEFNPSKKTRMIINTKLSTAYTNPEKDDRQEIKWTFYSQYDEETPEEITPITGSNRSILYIVFAIILFISSLIVFVLSNKKDNKKAI